MRLFKEHNKPVARALKMITQEQNCDYLLEHWLQRLITGIVKSHNPCDMATAMIQLNKYVREKKLPTLTDKPITEIIQLASCHDLPLNYINALIFLENNAILLKKAVYDKLINKLNYVQKPGCLIKAIQTFSRTSVLLTDTLQATDNFNKITRYADLWFEDEERELLFNSISQEKFTQIEFELLIDESKKTIHIDIIKRNISELLYLMAKKHDSDTQIVPYHYEEEDEHTIYHI
jgi:hypothetical protein